MTRVVMEATSDYWRAPFYLLEDRFGPISPKPLPGGTEGE